MYGGGATFKKQKVVNTFDRKQTSLFLKLLSEDLVKKKCFLIFTEVIITNGNLPESFFRTCVCQLLYVMLKNFSITIIVIPVIEFVTKVSRILALAFTLRFWI